ncbi:MAG: excinuclease ABC subunit UvrA [Thermodesulfovibrionales bacterium]
MQNAIIIRGAREHNLKNLSLTIPRDAITVVTGPSGSGKSSLAIDTIYAEGQRRYVESLSAYSRQFLEQMQKPDVDAIEGLSPSIAIDQKTVGRSPRSTLGTITEIYDYLRVLFTRLGRPYCYKCGSEISTQESGTILNAIYRLPAGSKIQLLAPIVKDRKGNYRKELQEMRSEGYVRARIDGQMADLKQEIILEKKKRHTIEIVIDRLIVRPESERQITAAVETAFRYADTIVVNLAEKDKDIIFSRSTACLKCGISYPDIVPRFFSFNSGAGACPSCKGIGFERIEEDGEEAAGDDVCPECRGARLRKEALSVRFSDKNIAEICRMPLSDCLLFFEKLDLSRRETEIGSRILMEIRDRLSFLNRVGLSYLTLDRPSASLSGGESQRIRLATQMGSSLTGVLYVLDEPSIGLHARDCEKLLQSLSQIRDAGNTVIVVEHDEETIRAADHVIDMGPGAGPHGGWVVAEGPVSRIETDPKSLTGRYLAGELSIEPPAVRRKPAGFLSVLGAKEHNLKNIDVDIPLGVFTCVTGVSGSGKSTLIFDILLPGLEQKLSRRKAGERKRVGFRELRGSQAIDRVISVDQAPIGRTPRANPATYTGFFTQIRELFALLQESRVRGYTASRFSFNLHGGRCETCGGNGMIKVEMHFLPDVYVPCDQCKGTRYNSETLSIRYKDRNIAEVLEMTVSEALSFFENVPQIRKKLTLLEEIGLGYVRLGQSATTLSGGESQRLRLSRELSRSLRSNSLYLLDEPTTGLHFSDIQKLLDIIRMLVDRGNTVIVIEHNLDMIRSADYVIDLGPEGGSGGGRVVACGTPEQVAASVSSHTGTFLRQKLDSTIKKGITR